MSIYVVSAVVWLAGCVLFIMYWARAGRAERDARQALDDREWFDDELQAWRR